MIARLVAWSIERRAVVLALTALFAAGGIFAATKLQFDALPDLTNNQVLVLTRAPGLTPEEVERLVTRPLESSFGGSPGLVEQRSLSRFGISSITLVFDDDVDPYRARQIVQERLNIASGALPPGVEAPELGPLTGGLGEIYHFTLNSPQRSKAELLELASFRVAPILRTVPGVVEVNSWGGAQRTLDVLADPVRLAQRGMTLEQLRDALEHATGSAAGTALPAGAAQVLLRGVARPLDGTELGALIVARQPLPGGGTRVVRLSEVADIREGAQPRIGSATSNGRGETVYVMVQMLRDANALEVLDTVHERMEQVRAVLPPDVRLDVVYDRSNLVLGTLRTVAKNLLEGGLLVAAVLFLMLGSLRAGLLVAAAIPLSMLGAVVAMVVFRVPGNLMSLGAIDFGLLVDGAVVMVEAVFHHLGRLSPELRRRLSRDEMRAEVSHATTGVAKPVFFSVLIILLVYVPVLGLAGVDGKLFRPMALTVVFALFTSLILSLTALPAAASLLLRGRDMPDRDPLLVRAIQRVYPPLLSAISARRVPVTLGAAALLALGAGLYARAGSEFTPQLDEGDLVIQTSRASDISLESAVEDAGRLERALLESVPEATQVVSRIGSPEVATDIMGLEMADVFVRLKPREQWRPGLSREALIAEIERAMAEKAPGGDPAFTQPIQMRFNELLGGAVTDISLSIYGDDLNELRRLADLAAEEIAKVPGAVDVRVLAPPSVSLLTVSPRGLDAANADLRPQEILDAVQALRTGIEVGSTYDGMLRVPILLRIDRPPTAFSLASFGLPSSNGGLVPLSRVADVRQEQTPSLVSRQDGERRLVVGFNVREADLGTVMEQIHGRLGAAVQLPSGYRYVWGGQYENLQAASRRLMVLVPVVLLLIISMLLAAFRSMRPAAIILTHVPFACVGGMVALTLRGLPVSMSAAIGFIALSGIAVLNGVVLLTRVLELERQGLSPAKAALDAARERSRPVLMTAMVAALGFVPMMLAQGVGAEVQRPLATVVVGGLFTSTALTLIILPTLYPWFSGRRSKETTPEAAAPAVQG